MNYTFRIMRLQSEGSTTKFATRHRLQMRCIWNLCPTRSYLTINFNAPLYAGTELVQVSMAGVIFLSLPAMFFRHDHIVVDLFPIFQRGYVGWVLSIIFLSISAYCLWIIADKTMFYANRSFEDGDTYEYILKPSFITFGDSKFAPRFIVETFIAISLFFTSFLIFLRLILLLSKPGSSPEINDEVK